MIITFMHVIFIDLTKSNAMIACYRGSPTYLRHLVDGRVLKYPIVGATMLILTILVVLLG